MSSLGDSQYRALVIANHYDDYNRAVGRKTWDLPDYVDGLVGDVGDLVKATMGFRDRRDVEDAFAKTEHELNDIMWSLLVLYKCLKIDPDESFANAMSVLEERVTVMKNDLKRKEAK